MDFRISSKIQHTNFDLTKFKCGQCQQAFTTKDKETNNWYLWWDTTRDPKIEPITPNYEGQDFILTAWVRDIEHEPYKCPDTKQCKGCFKWFLKENMQKLQDYYWCSECSTQKEVNHV